MVREDSPFSSRSQVKGTSGFLETTGMNLLRASQLDSCECRRPANSTGKILAGPLLPGHPVC